ncbi:3-hydroxybutyrate dehydrogenase [Massilia glaciei]|uniref:3-hydroxybutyrate dehydrogenase n=1 Tax=Massilia glaciei TaxID=1524097 RepID=A0A2U2I4G8_9BURK|nr:3-hydroxybutyrate dehydrogenase [Massilia glaciei]PWF54631.1 3-hydroxybutyrate dehydrogenase [Massilia glaciei]
MLRNKSALVTGSTGGIGLGIARALAAQGANIVLNGFGDPHEIEALRVGIAGEFGVDVIFSDADMAAPQQIRALFELSVARMGRIDILVNNAGIQHTAPAEQFPDERWDAIMAINLSSNFHAIKAALPHMRAQGAGRIVNIASVHGLVASTNKSAYVAAKHGVIGLSKAIALETAGAGITCNAVCPGWVLTPLVQKQIDALASRESIGPEQAQQMLLSQKQPSGEFATPAQLGALVVFLCSDAAGQISGAAMTMDGGWTAQ